MSTDPTLPIVFVDGSRRAKCKGHKSNGHRRSVFNKRAVVIYRITTCIRCGEKYRV